MPNMTSFPWLHLDVAALVFGLSDSGASQETDLQMSCNTSLYYWGQGGHITEGVVTDSSWSHAAGSMYFDSDRLCIRTHHDITFKDFKATCRVLEPALSCRGEGGAAEEGADGDVKMRLAVEIYYEEQFVDSSHEPAVRRSSCWNTMYGCVSRRPRVRVLAPPCLIKPPTLISADLGTFPRSSLANLAGASFADPSPATATATTPPVRTL